MEAQYYLIILITLVGFVALAALLLVPVYRFLRREEKAAEMWSEADLKRRAAARDGQLVPGSQEPGAQSAHGAEGGSPAGD